MEKVLGVDRFEDVICDTLLHGVHSHLDITDAGNYDHVLSGIDFFYRLHGLEAVQALHGHIGYNDIKRLLRKHLKPFFTALGSDYPITYLGEDIIIKVPEKPLVIYGKYLAFGHAEPLIKTGRGTGRDRQLFLPLPLPIIYYILYLPKSSGESFSRTPSHFPFSAPTLTERSILLERSMTFLLTKIGESDLKARAMASLGLASTAISFFPLPFFRNMVA